MRSVIFPFQKILASAGGCLLPSLFICSAVWADTISLKNGRELKGLVVEKHVDRIILSTEKGEIPILVSGVKKILYDDAEQNYFQVGKAYEAENKLGEALAYYEKALEVNPGFEEARKASMAVRSRFWASATEGPRNEIETKQVIYDAWGKGRDIEEFIKKSIAQQTQSLKETLGLALEKRGDWVIVALVDSKKDAARVGLKKNDQLVTIDGRSLRYLGVEAVRKDLLVPRYSNFTLEFERTVFLKKPSSQASIKDMGLDLSLEYQGLVVKSVQPKTAAEAAGLKEQDLLVEVDRQATRYMPIKKAVLTIESANAGPVPLRIRRSALLTRR